MMIKFGMEITLALRGCLLEEFQGLFEKKHHTR